MPASLFISFEGVDGAGKTTQIKNLQTYLLERGRSVTVVREPGGTDLGEEIREMLLRDRPISPGAEASLFAAARAQLVEEIVRPALDAGVDVISDRYLDSSLAYQGHGRGIDMAEVLRWNRTIVQGLMPDRTFLLSLPAEDVSLRLTRQLQLFDDLAWIPLDRLENEPLAFKRRVEHGFLLVSQWFPDRIHVIDASTSVARISKLIRNSVSSLLRERERAAPVPS